MSTHNLFCEKFAVSVGKLQFLVLPACTLLIYDAAESKR